jgi:GntR family transcriptional repressor for pyruvate dehydrogenase complex
MVAAALRDQIVTGELADDDTLPALERLVESFGVSRPSVREALRVLENEGLITVRRGNLGGALIHRPQAESAAYMLGLVMQSRNVGVVDLAGSIGELLTTCACMCARRRDRAKSVMPTLRRAHERAVAAIAAPAAEFEPLSRRFHQVVVDRCGNESLALVFSMLDWLWSAQEEAWSTRITHQESPDMKVRQLGIDEHKEMLDAIASGDVARTTEVTRRHVENPEVLGLRRRTNHRIRATNLMPGRAPTTVRAVGVSD